jgi:hypothetical protein
VKLKYSSFGKVGMWVNLGQLQINNSKIKFIISSYTHSNSRIQILATNMYFFYFFIFCFHHQFNLVWGSIKWFPPLLIAVVGIEPWFRFSLDHHWTN